LNADRCPPVDGVSEAADRPQFPAGHGKGFAGLLSAMQFDDRDERTGIWTRVIVASDRVEFRPTSTYAAGAVVGVLFAGAMAYSLGDSLLRVGGPIGWGLFVCFAMAMVGLVTAAFRWPATIVVCEAEGDGRDNRAARERHIGVRQIAAIIPARMRAGRQTTVPTPRCTCC